MGFFKSKGGYIDYTILKKKNLLSEESPCEPLDLASLSQGSAGASVPIAPPKESPSPFAFLDNPSSLQSSQHSSLDSEGSFTQQSSTPSQLVSSDLNALKIKVDDLEYKLERIMEKISKMESSLQ